MPLIRGVIKSIKLKVKSCFMTLLTLQTL